MEFLVVGEAVEVAVGVVDGETPEEFRGDAAVLVEGFALEGLRDARAVSVSMRARALGEARSQRPEARVERMIRGRMALSGFWGVDSGFVERSLGDAVADDQVFRLGRVGEEFGTGGVDSLAAFVGCD